MDEKKWQSRLIPVNIIVMILSLVAALSIMFLPLIKIDLSKGEELLDGLFDDAGSTEADGEFSGEFAGMLKDALEEVDFKVTGLGFIKLASTKDPVTALTRTIADSISEAANKTLVTVIVNEAAKAGGENTDRDLSGVDAEEIYGHMKELETTSTPDAVIKDLAADLAKQCDIKENERAEFEAQVIETLTERYDTTKAISGSFSIEAMVCITVSEATDTPAEEYMVSYDDMIGNVLNTETGADLSEFDSYLHLAGVIGAAAIGFFAGVWAILFLFAFFHLFASNKRFTMWYVKIFGGVPCVIFWLLPLVATGIIKKFINRAEIAAIFALMGSTAWISGLCYVLLWLVSIFWAFPIKRKIRQCKG